MIRALVTQRVDHWVGYDEYRDGIDRRWHDFFAQLQWLPVYVPNDATFYRSYLNYFKPQVIVLTGGNSIKNDECSQHRNVVEKALIQYGVAEGIPIIGVCHGMQMILHYFDQKLDAIPGHVGVHHTIQYLGQARRVNSYHQIGLFEVDEDFEILAKSHDESIEAIQHRRHAIRGMLWHPERCAHFEQQDLDFFQDALI